MKKGLRFGGGIFFGIMLLVATFVFSVGFASADGLITDLLNVSSPIRWWNYSTTINLSVRSLYGITGSVANSYNITLYCNKSGGPVRTTGADSIRILTMTNTSATQMVFENSSVNIGSSVIARANESRIFNCSVYADNMTNSNWSTTTILSNITFDSSPPEVNFSGITNARNYWNYSTGRLTINVSVRDNLLKVSAVYMKITFSNGSDTSNWTQALNSSDDSYYNITIDMATFQDGTYNVTVYANDSNLTRGYNLSYVNLNNTERIYFTIDHTNPTGSVSCTPNPITSGATITCSCSGSDATSGVNSTSITANPSTSDTGTFTSSCTIIDRSGNSGAASTTYNVELGGSSSGGGGPGSSIPSTDKKTNQWTKITPGAATIMKNFNPAIGLKEIQITVNNNAQNVKITVTKYDSKPASVIVEKTGKVYKYLEIKEENLKEKLSKAVIKTQVLKSWMENQGLNKGDIALFKFDNSTSNWKELVTTLMGEDDNYYYYDAEVTSFSYFAIGDKISEIPASEEESVTPTSSEEGEEKSKSVWLWAIVITMAVVIAVVGWVILSKKKRR